VLFKLSMQCDGVLMTTYRCYPGACQMVV